MASIDDLLSRVTGFEWDAGNADKNERRHGVSRAEAEEVFLMLPVLLLEDPKHSRVEPRFAVLGVTAVGRLLSVVFTVRGSRIRVISARPMSRRERAVYAKVRDEVP